MMQGDPICHASPRHDDPDVLECLRCLLIWRKDDESRPACPLAVSEQLAHGRTFAQVQNDPIESSYTIDCPLSGEAITAITIIALEEGSDPRRIIARAVDLYIAQRRNP